MSTKLIGVLGDVIGQRAQAVTNDGDGQGRGRLAESHLVGEEGCGDTAGQLASEYPEKDQSWWKWRLLFMPGGICVKPGFRMSLGSIPNVAEDRLDDAGVDGSWALSILLY